MASSISSWSVRPRTWDRWLRAFSSSSGPSQADGSPTPPTAKPRQRFMKLSNLAQSAVKLNFRSVPYSSPPSLLFPIHTPESIHVTHSSQLFTLRAFPSPTRSSPRALSEASHKHRPTPPPTLHHTTSPLKALLSPGEVLERERRLVRGRKGYTMELTIMAGKAKVHKSAVIRERCKRRFREAVRLAVMRGASKDQPSPTEEGDVVLDEAERGVRRWLVPGFMYVAIIPNLEIYRHPLPDLVGQVAIALSSIRSKAGQKLLARQLDQIEVPPVARGPDRVED